MRIKMTRVKKGNSEIPAECQTLIDRLRSCSRRELARELGAIDAYTFGKSELYHWIDVLDIFDGILEEATFVIDNDPSMAVDSFFDEEQIKLVLAVLHFTTLLIEHSFSRHLYSSVEHLTTLLSSNNMQIVLGVLNLLYMFSKRSNFIPRLNSQKRTALLARLMNVAESWGGRDHGFGLAQCCSEDLVMPAVGTFYYEYYDIKGSLICIDPSDVEPYRELGNPGKIANLVCLSVRAPLDEDQRMIIFTRVRLMLGFHKYNERLQFVLARLQALSVLVYSNSLQDNLHQLLYPGFLEELVELLEMRQPHLVEIRAAALRTLTSIIHLDRNPHFPKKPGSRLSMIIDVTGAGSYHGFLPQLVRTCIQYLTQPDAEQAVAAANCNHPSFPLPLATALFSFLYHLASYDTGGESLVACGMMESLLRVINWPGTELEHITFVTRAVRVIDLITNIEMQSFQAHGGLNSFIGRLDMEVNFCRAEQPFEIVPLLDGEERPIEGAQEEDVDDGDEAMNDAAQPIDIDADENQPQASTSAACFAQTTESGNTINSSGGGSSSSNGKICLPQRAALLKSMLNFLKKAIQDSSFQESIRHVMEGTLPSSLRHIISNAEYYGPSLFLLATDVVTVYVFQEPSLLFSLQDSGLTDVVLQALLKKDVPATREVLGSLPNVFSALCLNARGLAAFIRYQPFEKLFQVLLSPTYLAAMRRRRSSDPMGDTASNLGNSMDELMRHQMSLRTEAITAIVKLLDDLLELGTNPKYICWRAQSKQATGTGDVGAYTGGTAAAAAAGSGADRGGPNRGDNEGAGSSGVRRRGAVRSRRFGRGPAVGAAVIGDQRVGNDAGSSDEDDDEEEEEASSSSVHPVPEPQQQQQPPQQQADVGAPQAGRSGDSQSASGNNTADVSANVSSDSVSEEAAASAAASATTGNSAATPIAQQPVASERIPIPLVDYIHNVMKFIDAILSNNSTDDHCRDFVRLGGLQKLLRILALPNLPVDCPIATSAQSVALVCKSVLNLAHEPLVLQYGMDQLADAVDMLHPLQAHWTQPRGSILLNELANCAHIETAFSTQQQTPLLHAMSAVHGYVVTLVHVCRTGQYDIRNMSLTKWGVDDRTGRRLLYALVQLYTALVWESTLLLALCTDDIIPEGCDFGKEDLQKLPNDRQGAAEAVGEETSSDDEALNAGVLGAGLGGGGGIRGAPNRETGDGGGGAAVQADTDAAEEDITVNLDITSLMDCQLSATTINDSLNSTGTAAANSATGTHGTSGTITATTIPIPSTQPPKVQKKVVASNQQLRYIKSLLGASSRLGRALAELFGLLVKLCVSNPTRTLQSNNPNPTNPVQAQAAARDIARVLSYILVDGLAHDHLPSSPIPKLKQTFLICSIGFTSPMLFNDKHYAYHLMLHHFVEEDGLLAFFDMFNYAMAGGYTASGPKADISFDTPLTEYPEGCGEFLDAWLMLLAKLVNTKAITDSPHTIAPPRPGSGRTSPNGTPLEFDAIAYLAHAHRSAFIAVRRIWNIKPLETYGMRMTESMMSIMRHVIKGERMIREQYRSRVQEPRYKPVTQSLVEVEQSARQQQQERYQEQVRVLQLHQMLLDRIPPVIPPHLNPQSQHFRRRLHPAFQRPPPMEAAPINEEHLQQLVDMGFEASRCREALYYTRSVEQATEYLLNHIGPNNGEDSEEGADQRPEEQAPALAAANNGGEIGDGAEHRQLDNGASNQITNNEERENHLADDDDDEFLEGPSPSDMVEVVDDDPQQNHSTPAAANDANVSAASAVASAPLSAIALNSSNFPPFPVDVIDDEDEDDAELRAHEEVADVVAQQQQHMLEDIGDAATRNVASGSGDQPAAYRRYPSRLGRPLAFVDNPPVETEIRAGRRTRHQSSTRPSTPAEDMPLDELTITEFSSEAVQTCLQLIDRVPSAVYKGTQLLATLYRRNSDAWRVWMLTHIVESLRAAGDELGEMVRKVWSIPEGDDDAARQKHLAAARRAIFDGEVANRFNVRLHICSLFLEGQYGDIRTPAMLALTDLRLMPQMVQLFERMEAFLEEHAAAGSSSPSPTSDKRPAAAETDAVSSAPLTCGAPKWLAQLILLLDLYEKVAVFTKRKHDMHRVTTRIWKWYDVSNGKWNLYADANNKCINDAYWVGDASVRLSVGRHRYTINFNCMSQVNEDSGNHRPVIMTLKERPKPVAAPTTQSAATTPMSNKSHTEAATADGKSQQSNESVKKSPKSKAEDADDIPTMAISTGPAVSQPAEDSIVPQPVAESTTTSTTPTTTTTATDADSPIQLPNVRSPIFSRSASALFAIMYQTADSDIETYGDNNTHNIPVPNELLPVGLRSPINWETQRISGLEEFDTGALVRTCVRLMSYTKCMDRHTLHALMRFCVRLTTAYANAQCFARCGGVRLLLDMSQSAQIAASAGYAGFTTLANLLIRHTLEDAPTLARAMEKVITARTISTIPPGYRELIFMLRRMSSAVARDPEVFSRVARTMLRIDSSALRRAAGGVGGNGSVAFSEADVRMIMRSVQPGGSTGGGSSSSSSKSTRFAAATAIAAGITAQSAVATTSASTSTAAAQPEALVNYSAIATQVVKDLLQALVVPLPAGSDGEVHVTIVASDPNEVDRARASARAAVAEADELLQLRRQRAAEEAALAATDDDDDDDSRARTDRSGSAAAAQPVETSRIVRALSAASLNITDAELPSARSLVATANSPPYEGTRPPRRSTPSAAEPPAKPLLPKSTILKALAEAVRSYQFVGIVIAEHRYEPTPGTMLRKASNGPITAMAFILDHMLPASDAGPDRECSAAARLLVAAMSGATDAPAAQEHIVVEVKAAMQRALVRPELPEKHTQLQLLAGLIPTMIENCPPDNPALMKIHQFQPRRNDIFFIMLRKSLIGDLARVTQDVDLSSPHAITTINAVMKPLETLLRMTNQPAPYLSGVSRKKMGAAAAAAAAAAAHIVRGQQGALLAGAGGAARSGVSSGAGAGAQRRWTTSHPMVLASGSTTAAAGAAAQSMPVPAIDEQPPIIGGAERVVGPECGSGPANAGVADGAGGSAALQPNASSSNVIIVTSDATGATEAAANSIQQMVNTNNTAGPSASASDADQGIAIVFELATNDDASADTVSVSLLNSALAEAAAAAVADVGDDDEDEEDDEEDDDEEEEDDEELEEELEEEEEIEEDDDDDEDDVRLNHSTGVVGGHVSTANDRRAAARAARAANANGDEDDDDDDEDDEEEEEDDDDEDEDDDEEEEEDEEVIVATSDEEEEDDVVDVRANDEDDDNDDDDDDEDDDATDHGADERNVLVIDAAGSAQPEQQPAAGTSVQPISGIVPNVQSGVQLGVAAVASSSEMSALTVDECQHNLRNVDVLLTASDHLSPVFSNTAADDCHLQYPQMQPYNTNPETNLTEAEAVAQRAAGACISLAMSGVQLDAVRNSSILQPLMRDLCAAQMAQSNAARRASPTTALPRTGGVSHSVSSTAVRQSAPPQQLSLSSNANQLQQQQQSNELHLQEQLYQQLLSINAQPSQHVQPIHLQIPQQQLQLQQNQHHHHHQHHHQYQHLQPQQQQQAPVRQHRHHAAVVSSAGQAGRQRRYQYLNTFSRNVIANAPVILERLLGPGASVASLAQSAATGSGAAGGLNASGSQSSSAAASPGVFRDATRVVVMDAGFGIFANNMDGGDGGGVRGGGGGGAGGSSAGTPPNNGVGSGSSGGGGSNAAGQAGNNGVGGASHSNNNSNADMVDQAGYLFGRSLAATLNSTPSPLHWWLEEAKVLGMESQSDICLTVAQRLMPELEAQRTALVEKSRSKQRKKNKEQWAKEREASRAAGAALRGAALAQPQPGTSAQLAQQQQSLATTAAAASGQPSAAAPAAAGAMTTDSVASASADDQAGPSASANRSRSTSFAQFFEARGTSITLTTMPPTFASQTLGRMSMAANSSSGQPSAAAATSVATASSASPATVSSSVSTSGSSPIAAFLQMPNDGPVTITRSTPDAARRILQQRIGAASTPVDEHPPAVLIPVPSPQTVVTTTTLHDADAAGGNSTGTASTISLADYRAQHLSSSTSSSNSNIVERPLATLPPPLLHSDSPALQHDSNSITITIAHPRAIRPPCPTAPVVPISDPGPSVASDSNSSRSVVVDANDALTAVQAVVTPVPVATSAECSINTASSASTHALTTQAAQVPQPDDGSYAASITPVDAVVSQTVDTSASSCIADTSGRPIAVSSASRRGSPFCPPLHRPPRTATATTVRTAGGGGGGDPESPQDDSPPDDSDQSTCSDHVEQSPPSKRGRRSADATSASGGSGSGAGPAEGAEGGADMPIAGGPKPGCGGGIIVPFAGFGCGAVDSSDLNGPDYSGGNLQVLSDEDDEDKTAKLVHDTLRLFAEAALNNQLERSKKTPVTAEPSDDEAVDDEAEAEAAASPIKSADIFRIAAKQLADSRGKANAIAARLQRTALGNALTAAIPADEVISVLDSSDEERERRERMEQLLHLQQHQQQREQQEWEAEAEAALAAEAAKEEAEVAAAAEAAAANANTTVDTSAETDRYREVFDERDDPQPPLVQYTREDDEDCPVEVRSELEREHLALLRWQREQLEKHLEQERQKRAAIEMAAAEDAARAAVASTSGGSDDGHEPPIPEGIDPSFLAALPPELRLEVITEHNRQNRTRLRNAAVALQNEHSAVVEVSSEFLAALPPSIQDEVLAQQRIEQQRQAAANANPEDPVDATALFGNMQPALRAQILADMEDSQIAALPPDLMAEAQEARRDWESRHAHVLQNQAAAAAAAAAAVGAAAPGGAPGAIAPGAASFSSVLRYRNRLPDPIYSGGGGGGGASGHGGHGHGITRMRWTNWASSTAAQQSGDVLLTTGPAAIAAMERQGRAMLDHESLSSLLVLLFVDEPKFNALRLQRVIRNLCYHFPTRDWFVRALLSIVQRCNDSLTEKAYSVGRPQWLKIRLDAALGNRNNVFIIREKPGARLDRRVVTPDDAMRDDFDDAQYDCAADVNEIGPIHRYCIAVHPLAAPMICRHALELLVSLSKTFPAIFLPMRPHPACQGHERPSVASTSTSGTSSASQLTATSSASATATASSSSSQAPIASGSSAAAPIASTSAAPIASTSAAPIASTSAAPIASTSAAPIASTSAAPIASTSAAPIASTSSAAAVATVHRLPPPPPGRRAHGIGAGGHYELLEPSTEAAVTAALEAANPINKILPHQQPVKIALRTDFWDHLLRLEATTTRRRKQRRATSHLVVDATISPEANTFDESPFGQLVIMLSYALMRKSSVLTDKMLRLLCFISNGLPDVREGRRILEDDAMPQSSVQHMRNAIEVLTGKTCSDEGLEDATTLLLNLSQCSNAMRRVITGALVDGAKTLAEAVRTQIGELMTELRQMNRRAVGAQQVPVTVATALPVSDEAEPGIAGPSTLRAKDGRMQDRFTRETVVIATLGGGVKKASAASSHELQLPSMVPLISKTSSQSFFLKILKIIIQIRDSVQDSLAKPFTIAPTNPQQQPQPQQPQPQPQQPVVAAANSDSSQSLAASVPDSASTAPTAAAAAAAASSNAGVTAALINLEPGELAPLSETIQLDDLWNTLSDCLVELEETADHHAVLVLQPAVEAFFLVHASSSVKVPEAARPVATANPSAVPPPPNQRQPTGAAVVDAAVAAPPSNDDNINIAAAELADDLAAQLQREQQRNNTLAAAIRHYAPEFFVGGDGEVDNEIIEADEPMVSDDDDNDDDDGDVFESQIEDDRHPDAPAAVGGADAAASTSKHAEANEKLAAFKAAVANIPPAALPALPDGELEPDPVLRYARGVLAEAAARAPTPLPLSVDQKKFLAFAEKHRTVLNQILRQSSVHLSDGPFAVLVDHTRILDFDVKRRYFRTELERMDDGVRREELAVHVHRVTVFEDSFRELYRRQPEEWKNRFYIVFEEEEGQDAGGLLREWYVIISREIFNPMYALFTVSPGDRVTYMINASSHANSNHLFYFKFVGRVIAKAIYDNKLLECYFTRSFYKHILGIEVNTQDMESEDYDFYKGLVFLMQNHVDTLGYDQTLSLEVQEFGVTEVRDLIPNGRNLLVTERNKLAYMHLVCQLKMSGSIKRQLQSFLEGFYDIIPKRLISIFNEQELELLISGLPNVDIEDLKANTEYHKYQLNSIQIQWFWRALRSFDQAERAKFLQFVTGTSKVPLQGFGALEGMNGTQKFQIHRDDRSTERLPSAHTCFNQLDLPVYKTYDKLRSSLLKAIHECSEGFGFA